MRFYNTFSKAKAPQEIAKLEAQGYTVETEELDGEVTIYVNL